MAEIIPMTEEQKFQLEIYKLVMNQKKKEPSNGKPKLHAIMASLQRC